MTSDPDMARRIPGSGGDEPGVIVSITPQLAGWDRSGLRVVRIAPGGRHDISIEGAECAVLPLAGSCQVETAGRSFRLSGRNSVFTHVTDWAYVGRDHDGCITSEHGGEFAVLSARCEHHIDPYRIDARMVPVEVRGAGHATRQLNNFLAPEIAEADRLVAVEVLTPRGNWSSWPSHKHDNEQRHPDGSIIEADLEEIYYYRIAAADGIATDTGSAFGMHRTYDLAADWDMSTMVRSNDVVLVPRGYHGPCIAAPEYDMYYLNVLAGDQPERTLAFADDPALAWIRTSWQSQETDPRVPWTSADGPVGPGPHSAHRSPMSTGSR